jgi:GTP cyclohydrolase I
MGHILDQLGLDLSSEHFADTPGRWRRMMQSFVQFKEEELGDILKRGFEETKDNILVVQREIPFSGLCAHHLLPFWGTASVGYIPRKRVVGLSKLTRLVSASGRCSPSTQEHITNLIADTLFNTLEPIGVGVITIAAHGCMAVRGVNAPQTVTQVNALRGQMLLNPQARMEFMEANRG